MTSLLAAVAWGPISFAVGRVGAALATGFLLTAAIPSLVQRFGPERMATTAAWINIGFFGAVTIGPLVGGAAAIGLHWRWFFAGLALLGLVGFALALFALPVQDPPNPDLPPDWSAFALAGIGTVAPFVAVSLLIGHAFSGPWFVGLLGGGTCALAALLVTEYHKEEPLSPVRPMSTSWPVIGILVSSLGGAVYVTLLSLAEQYLQTEREAVAAGDRAHGLAAGRDARARRGDLLPPRSTQVGAHRRLRPARDAAARRRGSSAGDARHVERARRRARRGGGSVPTSSAIVEGEPGLASPPLFARVR